MHTRPSLLQFQILSGGDRFANLVQWFSMVGSLVGASLIARQLGADHRGQALAAAVAATIPMGILQGSSTQNDYVEAFWLVCLTHYVLQSTRRASRTNACAMGASLALAVLTKGTAYLYAIPLLVWWAAATVRQWRSSAWQPAVIVVVVALSVNAGLYARNLELWGNPLGIGGSNPYAIGMVGVRVLASNAVRAIGLQLGTPSGRLNRVIDRGVRALHVPLRLDVNDPRTTMRDSPFVIRYSLLDDLAGSPLHLALVVMALVLVPASPERRRTRVTYAIALVGVALVFCGLLRCGAMNNRLLLPLFVLASPLVAVTLQERARGAVVLGVVGVLVGAAIPDLVRNETRPLVGIGPEGTVLGTPRLVQLLKRHTDLRDDYMGAAEFVGRLGCADVGLVIGDIDLEYPWWVLLHGTVGQPPRIEHVNVKNVSAVTETRKPFVDFAPCAVIVMDADRISWVLAEQANYTQAWIGDKGRAYRQGWSSGTVRVFVRR